VWVNRDIANQKRAEWACSDDTPAATGASNLFHATFNIPHQPRSFSHHHRQSDSANCRDWQNTLVVTCSVVGSPLRDAALNHSQSTDSLLHIVHLATSWIGIFAFDQDPTYCRNLDNSLLSPTHSSSTTQQMDYDEVKGDTINQLRCYKLFRNSLKEKLERDLGSWVVLSSTIGARWTGLGRARSKYSSPIYIYLCEHWRLAWLARWS
jgi:hypothetical protein